MLSALVTIIECWENWLTPKETEIVLEKCYFMNQTNCRYFLALFFAIAVLVPRILSTYFTVETTQTSLMVL
jgi:hypothetical protein